MAAREIPNEVVRTLLAVGDEINENYDATANRTEITEAVRLARSIADWFYVRPTVIYHQGEREEKYNQASWLSRFKNVVDVTLEWLEHSGQVPAGKLEQVLRGLYNLTELANHAQIFAIMELTRELLNTNEDPFPGERQYIVQCFEDVKTQQEQIGSLMEQASVLLNGILENEEVDYIRGRQFDNVIREARVQIESCERRLEGAEQAIFELSQKMGTVKWASRGLRATGWALSSYYLFKRYQESNSSSMDLLIFAGGVLAGGWLWMSLFPGRASEYYESLPKLQADHRILQEKLKDLRVSLKSAKDHRDGL